MVSGIPWYYRISRRPKQAWMGGPALTLETWAVRRGTQSRFSDGRTGLSELDCNLNRTQCNEGELGTKTRGHSYQVGERLSFHLSHHVAPMCLHRDLANL